MICVTFKLNSDLFCQLNSTTRDTLKSGRAIKYHISYLCQFFFFSCDIVNWNSRGPARNTLTVCVWEWVGALQGVDMLYAAFIVHARQNRDPGTPSLREGHINIQVHEIRLNYLK